MARWRKGLRILLPGASASYTFTPEPAGFRWYHTHVMAGSDLKQGLYTGQHGFLCGGAEGESGAIRSGVVSGAA